MHVSCKLQTPTNRYTFICLLLSPSVKNQDDSLCICWRRVIIRSPLCAVLLSLVAWLGERSYLIRKLLALYSFNLFTQYASYQHQSLFRSITRFSFSILHTFCIYPRLWNVVTPAKRCARLMAMQGLAVSPDVLFGSRCHQTTRSPRIFPPQINFNKF